MTDLKKDKLNGVYRRYADLFKHEKIVFGTGDIDSSIMFIGEAPGRDELKKGEPFVGKAGEKFGGILMALDLAREDVFITNTIKYGLRKTDPVTGRQSNRPVRKEEMIMNRPFLLEEIGCIGPDLIVTLGAVPLKTLILDLDLRISDYTGKCLKYADMLVFPLFHPAALIYDPSLVSVFDTDLKALRQIIGNHCKSHAGVI